MDFFLIRKFKIKFGTFSTKKLIYNSIQLSFYRNFFFIEKTMTFFQNFSKKEYSTKNKFGDFLLLVSSKLFLLEYDNFFDFLHKKLSYGFLLIYFLLLKKN